jgi:hypothetical protein
MGRHQRSRRQQPAGRRVLLALAAALFVVLAGGGVAVARGAGLLGGGPGADGPGEPVLADVANPLDRTGSGVPVPLRECARSVRQGEVAFDAAQAAYTNWSGHVQAQLDYDAGRVTLDEARQAWADTKETASTDIADFEAAHAVYRSGEDACAELLDTDVPAGFAQVAARCLVRAAGVTRAVDAADGVVRDWSDHVAMMAERDQMDPAKYGQMWFEMVAVAPKNLDAFDSMSSTMGELPSCDVAR